MEVRLAPEVWSALEAMATQQAVALERLVEHAVIVELSRSERA